MIFGRGRDKGIRLAGMEPEVVSLGGGTSEADLLVHDERAEEPTLAYLLSRMYQPRFPEPIGVFRAVERPVYDVRLNEQIEEAVRSQGAGDLDSLFREGETWEVGGGIS